MSICSTVLRGQRVQCPYEVWLLWHHFRNLCASTFTETSPSSIEARKNYRKKIITGKKNKTWRKANEEPQRSDPSPRKCNTLSQTYSCQKQVRVRQDPACNNTWQCALFHTFLSGLLFHWSHPQEESPMFGLEPHIQNKNKIIFPCIFKISALGV